MNKIVPRAVALVLSLIFVFSAFPQPSFAVEDEGGKCGDKLFWRFDASAKTLYIYGEGKMVNYRHYTSPDGQAPWFDFRHQINTLIIDEGCTEIGDFAFYDTCVENLVLPKLSLKKIGKYAFYHSFHLKSIELPDGVVYLGYRAFANCDSVTSMKFGKGFESIPLEACSYMDRLAEVTLSENTKKVCSNAFFECISLKSIDLSSVEILESYAFYNCTALSEVTLGENLKEVGNNVFRNSSLLSEIELHSVPEKFSSNSFAYTAYYDNLETGPYTLCDGKILCNKGRYEGETIVIPDGVELIADYCFINAYYVTELVISPSVKVIGDWAFFNSRSLMDVYIPDTVEKIGTRNFGYMQENSYDYFTDTVKMHGKYGGAGHRYAMENKLCFVCEHEFGQINAVSDCTAGGYIYTACDCGFVSEKVSVPPAAHNEVTETVAPTCQAEGSVTVSCCDCGMLLSRTVIPKKAHDTSGGYTLGALPSCEENGYLSLICRQCRTEVSRRIIEKRGHSENPVYTIYASTCTEEGRIDAVCPDCGKLIESTPTAKKGHTPEEDWTVITPSSGFAVPGLRVRLCTECKNAAEYMWYFEEDEQITAAEEVGAAAAVTFALSRAVSGYAGYADSEACIDFNADGKISSGDTLALRRLLSESK